MIEISITRSSSVRGETRGNYPPLDLFECGNSLVLIVELPGVSPDDIIVKIYENVLTIEGVKKDMAPEGGRYICVEREFSRFRRSVSLPVRVDPEKGVARMKNGILRITLPIQEERVHKIKIIKE